MKDKNYMTRNLVRLLFIGAIAPDLYVQALGSQIQSKSLVELESGAEILSESFLNAEATATAQMVAQQEALLQQENKINEKENQKFIEVLNEKDIELVGHDENGIPDGSSTEVVPNVFKNYNAQTGASIGDSDAKPVKVATPE